VSWRTEFLDHLAERQARNLSPLEREETHMVVVIRAVREGLTGLASDWIVHYEADGMEIKFRFADGKTYRLKLEEVRK
jgi:hypothetical protein